MATLFQNRAGLAMRHPGRSYVMLTPIAGEITECELNT
jgi:hypothetical protein